MLTFHPVYAYGLNDRAGDEYMVEKDSRVVVSKFLPLHRPDCKSFLKQNFVKILTRHLGHHLKDVGYFIRVFIKSFKKPLLKRVCNDVKDFLNSRADSFPNHEWYKMT